MSRPQTEHFAISKLEREQIDAFDHDIVVAQEALGRAHTALQEAIAARRGGMKMVLQQHGVREGHWDHHKGFMVRDREAEARQGAQDKAAAFTKSTEEKAQPALTKKR